MFIRNLDESEVLLFLFESADRKFLNLQREGLKVLSLKAYKNIRNNNLER